jgi:hypothetical protein
VVGEDRRWPISHVTSIDTKLDDAPSLKSACKELGITLAEKVDVGLGYGNVIKGADFSLTLKNGAKVALVWSKAKKKYEIKTDLYDGRVENELGKGLSKLTQYSALKKLTVLARKNGYRVSPAKVDAKTGELNCYLT